MRTLRVLAVAAVLLAAGCSADEPPPTNPPPSSPSARPSPTGPRPLSVAAYQALLKDIERDFRSHLDKVVAARTPAQVDAVRRSLVAVLIRRTAEWEKITPPPRATAAHRKIESLLHKYFGLRDNPTGGLGVKNDCGLPPPVAQHVHDLQQNFFRTVGEEDVAEARAAATEAGLKFGGGVFPHEPAEPKLTDRRPRSGTIVQRSGRRGPSSVRITNDSYSDVAVLMDAGRGQPRVMVYVRADATTTVRGVAGNRSGTFSIKVKSGTDWDQRRRGFTRGCSYESFAQFFDTRSNWRISLAKTPSGNALTFPADPF